MRIFVTGATGVIGRRVVPLLVAAGHEITAVARSKEREEALSGQGAAPARIDLFDAHAVRRAVEGHDAVINLATRIPPSSKAFMPGAWKENDRIRRDASRNVVDAAIAAGATRVIQESFAGIYPDCGDAWIHEDVPPRPAKYVRSMLEAERQAERFAASGGAGVVLRFALFYGPDSSHTTDTIAYVRKGKAPTFGHRDAFTSSVSTDDAATAVVAALNVPAGIYNVCDDDPVRRHVYFETLADALGVGTPWMPPAWLARFFGSLGETIARSQRLSNEKFRRISGWAPRYPSVRDGWPAIVRELASRNSHTRNRMTTSA